MPAIAPRLDRGQLDVEEDALVLGDVDGLLERLVSGRGDADRVRAVRDAEPVRTVGARARAQIPLDRGDARAGHGLARGRHRAVDLALRRLHRPLDRVQVDALGVLAPALAGGAVDRRSEAREQDVDARRRAEAEADAVAEVAALGGRAQLRDVRAGVAGEELVLLVVGAAGRMPHQLDRLADREAFEDRVRDRRPVVDLLLRERRRHRRRVVVRRAERPDRAVAELAREDHGATGRRGGVEERDPAPSPSAACRCRSGPRARRRPGRRRGSECRRSSTRRRRSRSRSGSP